MKKSILLSVICLFLMVLVGCGTKDESTDGNSKVKEMKFGLVVAEDHPLAKGAKEFKEIVEEETNGDIEVNIFTDGQLGGDRDMLEGLQLGTLQATNVSTAPISSFDKSFDLLDLPFLFEDYEAAYKLLDGPVGQELLDSLSSQGIIGLDYWENGFRQLTNSKREVKSIEDIKGLKIRTMENDLHLDAWKKLGALPTPMGVTELFSALQQGVVDGQENPYANIVSQKFFEVQDYLTITNHVYSASVMAISQDFWKGLSKEEQDIIKNASEKTKVIQREISQKDNEESLQFLIDNGLTVTELSPESLKEFKDTLQPIYEQYKDDIGSDLVDKALESLE